jgi:hypothetical protein
MERVQFDIRHFLRSPDGKKMLTHPPVKGIKDEVIPETVPSSDPYNPKPVNMAAIFLIITLIVIAVVVFIYIYNRKHNSTKEIINQNIKENGKH